MPNHSNTDSHHHQPQSVLSNTIITNHIECTQLGCIPWPSFEPDDQRHSGVRYLPVDGLEEGVVHSCGILWVVPIDLLIATVCLVVEGVS